MNGATGAKPAGAATVRGSPETSAILCQGLSKTYGKIQALAELDL